MTILKLFRRKRRRSTKGGNNIDPRSPKPPSRLAQFGAWFRGRALFWGGGDAHEVTRVPRAATRSLEIAGRLVIIAMLVNHAVWASAAYAAETPLWLSLMLATLPALVIAHIDRELLASFLQMDGEKLLAMQNQPGYAPVEPWRRWLLVGGRFFFSIAVVLAASILMQTALFRSSIENHLTRENTAINQAVRERAETALETQIADARAMLTRLRREREALGEAVGRTDLPADTAAIDRELRRLNDAQTAAIAEYNAAHTARAGHLRGMAAERTGAQVAEGDTGRRGEGDMWTYHRDMAAQSTTTMESARTRYAAAAQRIRDLNAARAQSTLQQGRQAETVRAGLNPRVAEADRRLAAAATRLDRFENNRPTAVRRLMTADAAYVPLRMGLMERVRALAVVRQGAFLVEMFGVALALAFTLFDLAPLLLALLVGVINPSEVIRVLDNQMAIDAALARRASRAARRRGGPSPIPANDTAATANSFTGTG